MSSNVNRGMRLVSLFETAAPGDSLDDFVSENGLSIVYHEDARKTFGQRRKCPTFLHGKGDQKDDGKESCIEEEEDSTSILQVLKRVLLQGLINILFEMTRGFGWGLGHGSGIRLLDAIYGVRH